MSVNQTIGIYYDVIISTILAFDFEIRTFFGCEDSGFFTGDFGILFLFRGGRLKSQFL